MRKPTPRFDTIDLLRGLSILAVVLLHTAIRFSFEHLSLRATLGPFLNHVLLQQGGNGVTIFFAISGFLITLTSIRRFGSLAALKPAVFYQIRFARIGPPLLLLLAVLTALHEAKFPAYTINPAREHLFGALASALTFTLNYYEVLHGYLPACWTVLWSLSIEEMFYLVFPITCVLFLRRRAGFWPWVALLLAFVVMGPFARTLWNTTDLARENSYLGGMSPIALGCLTAVLTAHLQTRLPNRRTLIALQTLGAFLILWMVAWPRWQWLRPVMHRIAISDTDDLILPFGVCLVMLASVLRSITSAQRPGFCHRLTAPIRWFGRHSYEVYLSHEFLVIAGVDLYVARAAHNAQGHTPGPLLLWFLTILLLTAPLGWLIARFFSEPLNRRLRPARS